MTRLAAIGVAVAVLLGSPIAGPPTAHAATAPTLAQLIGRKLIVRMDGTTPSS